MCHRLFSELIKMVYFSKGFFVVASQFTIVKHYMLYLLVLLITLLVELCKTIQLCSHHIFVVSQILDLQLELVHVLS